MRSTPWTTIAMVRKDVGGRQRMHARGEAARRTQKKISWSTINCNVEHGSGVESNCNSSLEHARAQTPALDGG